MTELQIRHDEREQIMGLIQTLYEKFAKDRKELSGKITESTPRLAHLSTLYEGGQRACRLIQALIAEHDQNAARQNPVIVDESKESIK